MKHQGYTKLPPLPYSAPQTPINALQHHIRQQRDPTNNPKGFLTDHNAHLAGGPFGILCQDPLLGFTPLYLSLCLLLCSLVCLCSCYGLPSGDGEWFWDMSPVYRLRVGTRKEGLLRDLLRGFLRSVTFASEITAFASCTTPSQSLVYR